MNASILGLFQARVEADMRENPITTEQASFLDLRVSEELYLSVLYSFGPNPMTAAEIRVKAKVSIGPVHPLMERLTVRGFATYHRVKRGPKERAHSAWMLSPSGLRVLEYVVTTIDPSTRKLLKLKPQPTMGYLTIPKT